MNTSIVSPTTELIVSIDDKSMVNKIKQALKLMKGVCSVKVKKESMEQKILNSKSYKAAMDDIEHGRVYEAESVEDMF